MCSCVYVLMCICSHVCMCSCVYVLMCVCSHVCMCSCMYVLMCVCTMCVCTYLDVQMRKSAPTELQQLLRLTHVDSFSHTYMDTATTNRRTHIQSTCPQLPEAYPQPSVHSIHASFTRTHAHYIYIYIYIWSNSHTQVPTYSSQRRNYSRRCVPIRDQVTNFSPNDAYYSNPPARQKCAYVYA